MSIILDKSIVKKIDRNPSHISNNHDTVDYIQEWFKENRK